MATVGIQVIPYQTAAHTSADLTFRSSDIPASLILDIASDFSGTGTIPVHYVGNDGIRLTPVLDSDGNAFAFSETNKHLPINSPCTIRLVKGVTADGAMGVNLHNNQL